jgi:hypothetical protein
MSRSHEREGDGSQMRVTMPERAAARRSSLAERSIESRRHSKDHGANENSQSVPVWRGGFMAQGRNTLTSILRIHANSDIGVQGRSPARGFAKGSRWSPWTLGRAARGVWASEAHRLGVARPQA